MQNRKPSINELGFKCVLREAEVLIPFLRKGERPGTLVTEFCLIFQLKFPSVFRYLNVDKRSNILN